MQRTDRTRCVQLCTVLTGHAVFSNVLYWQDTRCSQMYCTDRTRGVHKCTVLTGHTVFSNVLYWQDTRCSAMYCTDRTHGVQQCTVLTGHTVFSNVLYWQDTRCSEMYCTDRTHASCIPGKSWTLLHVRAETYPATFLVDTPGSVHVITALGAWSWRLCVLCW